ncbi:TonB-dependent siderophore receptor [Cupriavidus basilensis]|uniref:TonB-dependent siderophore receptor n=1 Tax=Cupriavidus basilensis TaxID=68895 RepID=A0ABT6AK22_9BURK|nr:TonB-dependent siderophore receptor [Cupriavidus basilensis]MDF3832949.1 TonB-dependent siderophore receptor [Cupriavidus basilensis]
MSSHRPSPAHAAPCLAAPRLSPIASAVLGLTVAFAALPVLAQTSPQADPFVLPAATVVAERDSAPAKAEKVSGGALGERKAVDTPFSVVAATSEEIQDRMAQTASDVFRYDPAVSVLGDNARTENSYFAVRGMRIDMLNGIKVDGQNFVSWNADLPLELFDQVELLKGLSGFMYGFGTPGGIINYVVKRPTDEPLRQLSLGYQANNVWSEKIDLGGRFGVDGRIGYRLNAVNEQGNTAEPNVHLRRQAFSLATDFRVTPDLTWTADVMYWKRKTKGTLFGMQFDSSLPIPDASKVSRRIAQPFSYQDTETISAGTGFDYRINDRWTASLKYRFARQERDNGDSFLSVTDAAGNFTDTLYKWKSAYYYQAYDAMVQGKFETGGIRHGIVAGIGYQSQVKVNDAGVGSNGVALGTNNLYNPTLLPNLSLGLQSVPFRDYKITQKSIYFSDTVQFTDRFSVLAGLRYTDFNQSSFAPSAQTTSSYGARPVSPTVALMYKTDASSTAYVSYVESLEQGGSADVTNANYPTVYGPLKSKQYEVGYKTDRREWGANIALFRVDRGYEYTNSANIFVQNGTQRFTGLDTSGWVRIARDVRLMGGVLLLNAKATGIDDPTVNGKRIFATPRYTVGGRIEYDTPLLPGLTLAAGAKITGDMAVDAVNNQSVPSYTTADLSARYLTRVAGKTVTLRAAVNNVFDKRYWTTSYGGFVLPGASRTFLANATVQF